MSKAGKAEIKEVVVSPARRNKALLGHYYRAIKNYTEGDSAEFRLSGDDLGRWYAKITNLSGLNNEFEGGEYLVEIRAPKNYPYGPPEFYFYTPNGIYEPMKKACVDQGSEHPDKYQATLGMNGFVGLLLSGMIAWSDLGAGRYIVLTTIAEKKKLAVASHAYNREKYPEIIALFDVKPVLPEKIIKGRYGMEKK